MRHKKETDIGVVPELKRGSRVLFLYWHVRILKTGREEGQAPHMGKNKTQALIALTYWECR